MPVAPTESPKKVRFGVLAFTAVMAVLLYLDRLMNIAWIFLATWLPTYLLDRYGAELGNRLSTPQAVAGMLTAMIGLMG